MSQKTIKELWKEINYDNLAIQLIKEHDLFRVTITGKELELANEIKNKKNWKGGVSKKDQLAGVLGEIAFIKLFTKLGLRKNLVHEGDGTFKEVIKFTAFNDTILSELENWVDFSFKQNYPGTTHLLFNVKTKPIDYPKNKIRIQTNCFEDNIIREDLRFNFNKKDIEYLQSLYKLKDKLVSARTEYDTKGIKNMNQLTEYIQSSCQFPPVFLACDNKDNSDKIYNIYFVALDYPYAVYKELEPRILNDNFTPGKWNNGVQAPDYLEFYFNKKNYFGKCKPLTFNFIRIYAIYLFNEFLSINSKQNSNTLSEEEKLKIYQGDKTQEKSDFQGYLNKKGLSFLYILLDNAKDIDKETYEEIIKKFRQYFNNLEI